MKRSRKHLQFVASLPCLVTKQVGNTPAAHIRMGLAAGTGIKPCDSRVVPLSVEQHAKQHSMPEAAFWDDAGIDVLKIAAELWEHSGEQLHCTALVIDA